MISSTTRLAYFLARISIAASMFAHGLVRMPKLAGFKEWMMTQFQHSMLPSPLVNLFGTLLPFAELLTGVLLLAGLFTRFACILGSLLMTLLIFGSGMIEAWDSIPSQLIHAAFFSVLLVFIAHNKWSLDDRLSKNKL